MMQSTLHPTPRGRDVVREQVRIAGLGLRREALVAAVVLGIVTLAIAREVVRDGTGIQFDSDASAPFSLVAFLFPFAVWKGERRFGHAFLWTLPVDRRRLALAKVFAGWVWLMAALAVFVVWRFALTFLPHVTAVRIVTLDQLTGATAAYLLGSALVLGLRHPLRWLLGAAGVFFVLAILNHALGRTLLSLFLSAAEHAAAVWRTLPDPAQWATTTFLWLGAGLAALWAAASRHRENR